MADTDTETLPNGTGGLSAAEEEDERLKQRPADIDADVREMERRKRVEALMSSKLFREELERVLDQQMNEGADAPLLQRIREMVGGRLHTGSMRGPSCVLPINDIRGIEGIGYEKGEKILRCKLAAVYRLVDLFGWTQTGQGSQITARLNTAVEQVLTTPRGLLPHELTASSLVKVDMQGVVQDQGTTNFPVNVAGFSVHASVHAARPDIRCVLHVRSPAALAVSAMRHGLLPLCAEAALLGDIACHTVPAGVLDNEERDKMVRVLGPACKLLFLSSNGALCCGETLEEAFYQAKNLTAACEVQLRLASLPLDSLILLDEETRKQMYEASRKPPVEGAKWRVGGEEFEALMRMLDNAGFRTGYIYRHPLVKNDVPKPKNDVEVPPAVSSLGYLLEEEEMYKQGLWKKGQGKVGERTRWLNSPNVYQKVEVLETGTNDPKKITKWVDANNEEWVQDGSPAHSSTPVKIDTLQFVPMKTNPKEFKALQQQIKDNRRADKISAGPQSHILEGVTWDEANKLTQAEDATHTHTGDHVVLMGAASKGIIQRGYQHNATVYSAPYARNPFDHVTDREIDEYRRTVERRHRGDYDTDLSESEAISAAQVTSPLSETEEESRDEHRVLRIETKQAPMRSQPEVVLSDVDTTDFLHAERVHAERTKGTNPASKGPARPKAPTPKLTPNPASCTNKRTHYDYARNTNFDNILKIYDSPETSPLNERKKGHPKCKVSLNSRLLSSSESVRADALEIYQTGHGSSRSSLYSIPSLEWDGRNKSEFLFKTRSLPRQSRKTNKARLFRTNSHAGFVNSFIKDPEPSHYHLPKCKSCGATNNSYAWELSKSRSGNLSSTLDNPPQNSIELAEDFDVVKIKQKEVPVFKVAEVIKESDNEFVESQEFNEDCYLGEMQSSYSSDNLTVIEKTPGTLHGLREQLEKLSPVDEDSKKVYNKVVIELKEKFDDSNDKNSEQQTITDPDIPKEVNKENLVTDLGWRSLEVHTEAEDIVENVDSMETIHGDYLNFSDDMDFTQAVYESPVKDLVEKDIRDYSVPINFYCEDYGKEDIKQSPGKRREVVKATILEPILEESKSSAGDVSNITQGDEVDNQSNRKHDINIKPVESETAESSATSGDCAESKNGRKGMRKETNTDIPNETTNEVSECMVPYCCETDIIIKPVEMETTESSATSGDCAESKSGRDVRKETNIPKEITNEVSECTVQKICDDILCQENVLQTITKTVLNNMCDRAMNVSQLKEELGKSAENSKFTTQVLETAYVYNKTPDYFVLEEGSDVTTFNLESVTHTAVETAMELYSEQVTCNEAEVSEDHESIIDSVYENIFEIFSNDAIRSDSLCLSTGDGAGKSSCCSDSICLPATITQILPSKAGELKLNQCAESEIPEPELSGISRVENENTPMSFTETQLDQQIIPRPNIALQVTYQQHIEVTTGEVISKLSLPSSRGYSLGSTIPEMPSFNTTLEFEKYEAVSEIIGLLLGKIDFSDATDIDILKDVESLKKGRDIKLFDSNAEEARLSDICDTSFDECDEKMVQCSVVTENLKEIYAINWHHFENSIVLDEDNKELTAEQTETDVPEILAPGSDEVNREFGIAESCDEVSVQNTEISLSGGEQDTFCIATIVESIDSQVLNANDTEVTDSSQISESDKIIESIIYYIFVRTFSLIANKSKARNDKKTKKVITVVDFEDILYTAKSLWDLNVVTETGSEAEHQANVFTSTDAVECSVKQIKSPNNKDTDMLPKTAEKVENETREPIKGNQSNKNGSFKLGKSYLDIGHEDDGKNLFSEMNINSESPSKKPYYEDTEVKESNCVIPSIKNTCEEDADPECNDTSKFHFEVISYCRANNIFDTDTEAPNSKNAVVRMEESCEEKGSSTSEEFDLDTAFNFTGSLDEDATLHVLPEPCQEILSCHPEIMARLDKFRAKVDSNTNIQEGVITDLYNNIIEIVPRETETDEIVPESVKSVISSVLDEEVDDQILQKSLETLCHPDNTFVFVKTIRGDAGVPFNFENMKSVFFNKDEIYDVQRHAMIEHAYSILEEILDKIINKHIPDDEKSSSEEGLEIPTHQLNDTFVHSNVYDQSYQEIEIYEDFEYGTVIAQDIVKDLLENSFMANEMTFGDDAGLDSEEDSTTQQWMDETFVVTHEQHEDMNTAFVEDAKPYHNSRFSSPVREGSKLFDTCEESPIVNTSVGSLGDDTHVLYEKEDTTSGSPFVKQNSVISMSQSFHSGGMKYWVSFDERLTENREISCKGPMRRSSENSTPSFIAINFDRQESPEQISRTSWDEQQVKRTGVLCHSITSAKSKSDASKSLYSMVTNESFHTACASKSDSFKTCESLRTPVEDSRSKQTIPEEMPQKVLLYNTSKDNLQTTWPYRRQYSSWPPFEETLFYRLISKFRLSESFDPSDLENCDVSL